MTRKNRSGKTIRDNPREILPDVLLLLARNLFRACGVLVV